MSIATRKEGHLQRAEHQLEKALDRIRATKADRVLGRRLFAEQARKPDRSPYDLVIVHVIRDVERAKAPLVAVSPPEA